MPYSSLFHLQFDAYQSCCFQFKYFVFFFFSRGCEHCEPCEPSLVTSAGGLQKGPLCGLHRATVPRQWINCIDFSYAILSCVNTEKQPCFFSESTLASGCIECMESGKACQRRQPCREPLQAVQPRCGIASGDWIYYIFSCCKLAVS